MKIWVDADACPVVIKEILFRAATRTQMETILVANAPLRIPNSPYIRMVQVPRGFDVADNHIVAALEPGDLVITADIPLAASVVERGAEALNPRGEMYNSDNVRELLDLRNFMATMRESGLVTGGDAAHNHGDRQAFANRLDQWLTKRSRTGAV